MPRAPRQHGTLAMRRRGECRTDPCERCLDAGRRYSRRQRKLQYAGRTALVDAGPARRHVRRLLSAGMTVVQIQEASGVNRTAIRVLIGDFPNRVQSKRIRPGTEKALLQVTRPLAPHEQPSGLVDGTGTRRRIEALMAVGHTRQSLAGRFGIPSRQLQIARHAQVLASTARQVAELYEILAYRKGPSSRVRMLALRRGYLPPLWWDEDTIDDPRAVPKGLREQSNGVLVDDPSLPMVERRQSLRRAGLSDEQIAERLGVTRRQLTRTTKEESCRSL